MDTIEYEFIKSRLNEPSDVDFLHEKMGFEKDMLFNILARKIVRKVMKLFYIIKKKDSILLSRWLKGESLLSIAKSIDFPPVLVMTFILSKKGFVKRELQEMITNPESIPDARLKKEIVEVISADFLYSPRSSKTQFENGQRAEGEIEKWLKSKKILFMTEKENKQAEVHKKTPDFLFKKACKIEGMQVNWIESKASFGSPEEMKRNYKRQLKPYIDLFGPGIVVYWYGFVDDVHIDDKLMTFDRHYFD